MLKYLSVFALFAATFALTGCKPKEQAEAEKNEIKAEQDKLQGKWKQTARTGDTEEGEEEEKTEGTSYFAYVVEGDMLKQVYVDKDGKENVWVRYKMAIIPGKTPKQIDLTEVDEAGKPVTESRRVSKTVGRGTKVKKTTVKYQAVYSVEGDKFTLCVSYDDKKRPADLVPAKGSAAYAVTLEKMK